MRNNKLLPINKIFKLYSSYPSSIKIFVKLQIHVNFLVKIEQILKNKIPKKLSHLYNVKNIHKNILYIEIASSSCMINFMSLKTNLIFFIRKTILLILKDIKFIINPKIFMQQQCYSSNIYQKYLSLYSKKLLLKLSTKSSYKLKNIIKKFVFLSKK
ncbi:hypothetical protein [Enterobacteriaceae endosymbiont of Macroplea appendiculata]|uniref:hypothetical protein n=1 Tax=Enterobacteriaceae endosymbiont of Macroplea appendiculata TaxID=2675790 RepID=UPI00144A07DC|nr:hypothetical protein [Enterobacteriaceae endosymbiont of Macroplea appendiculata]QJC30770.1 hypothetical protein GJT86_00740 [Enterobacteriaceae endosymbiont of Macroplea appendiculata]